MKNRFALVTYKKTARSPFKEYRVEYFDHFNEALSWKHNHEFDVANSSYKYIFKIYEYKEVNYKEYGVTE